MRIKRHNPTQEVAATADTIIDQWSSDALLACAYHMLVAKLTTKDANSNLTMACIRLRVAEYEAARDLERKRA